jgi:hypothetical protein
LATSTLPYLASGTITRFFTLLALLGISPHLGIDGYYFGRLAP